MWELINKKKKRTCHLEDFAVPAGHRMNIKESEKMDLFRERKKAAKYKGVGDISWNVYQRSG